MKKTIPVTLDIELQLRPFDGDEDRQLPPAQQVMEAWSDFCGAELLVGDELGESLGCMAGVQLKGWDTRSPVREPNRVLRQRIRDLSAEVERQRHMLQTLTKVAPIGARVELTVDVTPEGTSKSMVVTCAGGEEQESHIVRMLGAYCQEMGIKPTGDIAARIDPEEG